MRALLEELYPYIILLYLIDGVAWLAVNQVFFISQWGEAFRFSNWRAFVFNGSPWGQIIVAQRLTFMPTPSGIYTFVAKHTDNGDYYQLDDFCFTAYADFDTVVADDTTVKVNATTHFKVTSPQRAQQTVKLLHALLQMPPAERAAAILPYWAESSNLDQVRVRHRAAVVATARLRFCSLLLGIIAFGLLPVALYGEDWIQLSLPAVGLNFLLIYGVTLGLLLYYQHTLYQSSWSAALLEQLGLLFSPISAVHAPDHLTRKLYIDFDPAAIAAILLPASAFCQLLRHELHRARRAQPLRDCPEWLALWQAREQQLTAIGAAAGFAHTEIFAPPHPQDRSAASYCPICHSEFRTNFDVCPDCEMALQHFPAASG